MTDSSPVAGAEFFQLGYVTSNLERAVDLWQRRYGVSGFFSFDTRDSAPPGSTGPFQKVALGYQGPVMVEFIQPDPANPRFYGNALREDGGVQLHHLGYMVSLSEFEGMKERYEAQGYAVPSYLTGDVTLLYADTRPDNGLYTEVVARTDFMLQMFAKIPPAQ